MKKFLKTFYSKSTLFVETFISVLSVVVFSRFFLSIKFGNLKKNHPQCIILTNGPSLRSLINLNTNKSIFKHQDIFTVNLFYESTFFYELKPQNHIIADSCFWNEAKDERMKYIHNRFKEKLSTVNWEMKLFVPYEGIKVIKKILKSNSYISLIPYNHTPVSGFTSVTHFLYRKSLGMPRPTNVLNAAIFLTLNMGYKNINIYGADHSWMKDVFIDDDNDICSYQNHFYDNEIIPYKIPKGTLVDGLRGIVEAFDSYKLLEKYSRSIGARIINRTKGSYIDIFDRE